MMGSKIVPCLLVALAGCAGNVIDGLPRDGGDVIEDPAGQTTDGGRDAAVPRDATVADTGTRDAGGNTTREDASTQPQTDSGTPSTNNDAGAPPSTGTALNGGALARPNNGRQFTATMSDWMGNPRCNEGTGQGQVLFCDDFESTDVGGPPGSAWSVAGTAVTVSDDQPFRGSKSMRYAPPSGMPGQMQETKAVPQKMFGRVFAYFFTDLPTTPGDAKFTLIQVGDSSGTTKGEVRLSAAIDSSRGNKLYYSVGSNGGDSGDWNTFGREAESEVKKGAWTCLEWMFDSGADETRIWINNVEQLSLHTTKANFLVGDEGGKQFEHPTYSYLKAGYWVYQSSASPNPAVLFLDEMIIDDEQIGCSL